MPLDLTETVADREAARRWESNLTAVTATQPAVAATFGEMPAVPWLFARDGSLTARDSGGHWWAGCSLPVRAGRAMLKRLDVRGVVGCLLAPTHAGQVVAALDKLQPQQALVVIVPDLTDAEVMLACGDFAADVRRHRLWLAVGERWREGLAEIFDENPGLPTPSQFVRLPITTDDVATPLIRAAKAAFNAVNAARAADAARVVPNRTHELLLVAPTHFRLWDDAGHALYAALSPARTEVWHLDPDDPAQASALHLARAAASCESVAVPDRTRRELPDVLPANVRVVTWVTQPRVAPYDGRHPQDTLLITDPAWRALARAAGWPDDRVDVAAWPTVSLPPGDGSVALICDTSSLETPVKELEHSSHHVLWELIRADLLADPFALRGDVDGFIERRRLKLGVAAEGFDRAFFVTRLLVPAYQQAIAARLLKANVPLRLFGRGWDGAPAFAPAHRGFVASREALLAAASASTLVYPSPVRHAHPIDALGRTVVGPWESESAMLRDVRKPAAPAVARPALSAATFGLCGTPRSGAPDPSRIKCSPPC